MSFLSLSFRLEDDRRRISTFPYVLLLFNVFRLSLSSSLSRLAMPHTYIFREIYALLESVARLRPARCKFKFQRSCCQWNGKDIVRLAAGTDRSRSKEITLLHPVNPYSGITRSLFSRFDTRLCQVAVTALWDVKRCRREGQRVLDQTASSESKDTNSYSTRCCRQEWHPTAVGSYGDALSPVSFCLHVVRKKAPDLQCLFRRPWKSRQSPDVIRFAPLRTGRFSRTLTEANNGGNAEYQTQKVDE